MKMEHVIQAGVTEFLQVMMLTAAQLCLCWQRVDVLMTHSRVLHSFVTLDKLVNFSEP